MEGNGICVRASRSEGLTAAVEFSPRLEAKEIALRPKTEGDGLKQQNRARSNHYL
jgi:hypothetical protein